MFIREPYNITGRPFPAGSELLTHHRTLLLRLSPNGSFNCPKKSVLMDFQFILLYLKELRVTPKLRTNRSGDTAYVYVPKWSARGRK